MFQPDYNDPLTSPFWNAARESKLAISWCDACNQAVWYPKPVCPACKGELYWRSLGGKATLLSWTVVRKPVNPLFAPPFIPALVVPQEAPGVRIVTQLVDCAEESIRCDMALRVTFQELRPRSGDGFMAPLFKPA